MGTKLRQNSLLLLVTADKRSIPAEVSVVYPVTRHTMSRAVRRGAESMSPPTSSPLAIMARTICASHCTSAARLSFQQRATVRPSAWQQRFTETELTGTLRAISSDVRVP